MSSVTDVNVGARLLLDGLDLLLCFIAVPITAPITPSRGADWSAL